MVGQSGGCSCCMVQVLGQVTGCALSTVGVSQWCCCFPIATILFSFCLKSTASFLLTRLCFHLDSFSTLFEVACWYLEWSSNSPMLALLEVSPMSLSTPSISSLSLVADWSRWFFRMSKKPCCADCRWSSKICFTSVRSGLGVMHLFFILRPTGVNCRSWQAERKLAWVVRFR